MPALVHKEHVAVAGKNQTSKTGIQACRLVLQQQHVTK